MKIVFFGNPKFAAESLSILCNNNINIDAVVSSPPSRTGRGKKYTETAVSEKAKELKIETINPINLNDDDLIKRLKKLDADLFIVIAFKKLPKKIWLLPKIGTINLHTSLLPNYRGAAPINRVLINGERTTGVTTFFINENIDSGDIIMQESIKINNETTAAQLHEKLIKKGCSLLLKTIVSLKKRKITLKKQSQSLCIENAPKITKETLRIDWSKSAQEIHNLIRGLSPHISEGNILTDVSICPSAWFILRINNLDKKIKIILSELNKYTNNNIKEIETDNKKFLRIHLKKGSILIKELQVEGKKCMKIRDFLNGFKINETCKII